MKLRISDRPSWALLLLLISCTASFSLGAAERPDILVADFEGANYGDWKVTGSAFGPGPAQGTLPGQMAVDGYLGKGLVNSYFQGDNSTGTLTSPPFKVERKYFHFLIGGGKNPGKLCINLLLDGKAVRTATGLNDRPGGSEHLDWDSWDVSDLDGKTVRIEIIDQATGGWGHINIDHIIQTDRRLPQARNAELALTITNRYLNFPVKNKAPKRRVSLVVEHAYSTEDAVGVVVRDFEIELAPAEPDFYVFLDLTPFQGKQALLRIDKLPEDSPALKNITQSDTIRGAENLYREQLRPQFHFSSRRGWNNDPNGLVFYQGEYHLFYQHNPYGWDWGNMHWGHAVSTNLVDWRELPIALYPRQFGDWVFSGSADVDKQNTAGWKKGAEDTLVAAFTSTGRGECIVYSNDRGRTWEEFSGNPVVKHNGRDPKLVWHEPTKKWVMALYDEAEGKRAIAFYTSPDLKTFTYESRIEGFFECPDLFELPVDGNASNKKWVLTAASSEYMVGQFDGKQFTPETAKLPGHRGRGFYAAQTYSDIPDGRRIQIGWGQMPSPGMPFNQMMTFPCELTLRTTPEGARLFFEPVKEIQNLRTNLCAQSATTLTESNASLGNVSVPMKAFTFSGELLDIQFDLEPGNAQQVGLTIHGTDVLYDAKAGELLCKDRRARLPLAGGKLRLRVLADRTSLEIFAQNGLVYMPMPAIAKEGDHSVKVFAKNGTARNVTFQACQLRSIWP